MSQMLGAGGTERQLTVIAQSLDRTRFEPYVSCLRPGGIRADELQAAGVPVVPFPISSLYKPHTFAAALALGKFLRRHQIDLVHTFDVPANLFGVPVAFGFRTPAILASQRAHRNLTPGFARHLLRLTDRLSDGIVVNSQAVRRELIEEYKVPANRIHLCYNGIDTQLFRPAQNSAPRPLTIGSVGLFRPEKGQRFLLEAFARLHTRFPDTRLLLVGGGPLESDLQALADQLGIAPYCELQPATGRVAEKLQSIDLFVLPSLSEALSNSLMEAMACGCCCLASGVGGNPELIEDCVSGLLFRPADAEDLAAKLTTLLDNPRRRSDYANAGLERIGSRFSVQASVEKMQAIYATVLDAKLKSL